MAFYRYSEDTEIPIHSHHSQTNQWQFHHGMAMFITLDTCRATSVVVIFLFTDAANILYSYKHRKATTLHVFTGSCPTLYN